MSVPNVVGRCIGWTVYRQFRRWKPRSISKLRTRDKIRSACHNVLCHLYMSVSARCREQCLALLLQLWTVFVQFVLVRHSVSPSHTGREPVNQWRRVSAGAIAQQLSHPSLPTPEFSNVWHFKCLHRYWTFCLTSWLADRQTRQAVSRLDRGYCVSTSSWNRGAHRSRDHAPATAGGRLRRSVTLSARTREIDVIQLSCFYSSLKVIFSPGNSCMHSMIWPSIDQPCVFCF